MALTLRSTAFSNGGVIPSKYTCESEDISPPLEWDGVPEQARSLVLIVDDPDAPDPEAPTMTWVHWLLYNIAPETTRLDEGASPADLPAGAEEGLNDWKNIGYGGPCPPIGRHRKGVQSLPAEGGNSGVLRTGARLSRSVADLSGPHLGRRALGTQHGISMDQAGLGRPKLHLHPRGENPRAQGGGSAVHQGAGGSHAAGLSHRSRQA